MQRIALAKAKPGMVLAQAVSQPGGLVLVGEGFVLTDTVIDRIRQSGVSAVCIEENLPGAENSEGDSQAVAKSLPFLFRRHKDDVFMMTLYAVFAKHFARRIAEEQAREDIIKDVNNKSTTAEKGSGAANE